LAEIGRNKPGDSLVIRRLRARGCLLELRDPRVDERQRVAQAGWLDAAVEQELQR
jgi:hypothetical protein